MADGLIGLAAIFGLGFVVGWIVAPALNLDEPTEHNRRR
jgi:uncharacterized membrane protein YciS (DUF1049 family)